MSRLSRIAIVFFLIPLLVECAGDKFESNKRIAVDRAEALNHHDAKALSQFYSPKAMGESPNWGGAAKGADSIVLQYGRYVETSPDWKIETKRILSASDHIVFLFIMSGTMTHPEKGSPEYMLGKRYSLEGCTILEIKEGKIIKEASYFDQVAFLRQVGFFDQK
jgi:steroid delta-isomerase-like uncharacterized protein